MPRYESAGLGLNPGSGSGRAAHPTVHLPLWAGLLMGTWGNLGKVNCGNLDVTLTLSQGNGFLPIPG